MKALMLLAGACGALALTAPGLASTRRTLDVPLSQAEVERTRGGMGVTFHFPNRDHVFQNTDNLAFDFTVRTALGGGEQAVWLVTADTETKIWGTVTSVPSTGLRIKTRTRWPLDIERHPVQLRYCLPEDPFCRTSGPDVGVGERQGMQISANARAAGVVFHRLNNSTIRPSHYIDALDQLAEYDWSGLVDSPDAIHDGCATTDGGHGGAFWVFRYLATVNDRVPAKCLTPRQDLTDGCKEVYEEIASRKPDQYHIFLVDGIQTNDPGVVGGGYAAFYSNFMALRDDYSRGKVGMPMAHEFGHSMGLGHVNAACLSFRDCGGNTPNCELVPGDPIPKCLPDSGLYLGGSCPQSEAGSNLMCIDGGRLLAPSQCTHMEEVAYQQALSSHENCLTTDCR